MTNFLIIGIQHGLTGKTGDAARFKGSLRVTNGRITEMGDLTPRPGERVIDAQGCVVCPGFVNTHHHLFQSVMKAAPAAINQPLDPWLMEVPYRFWPKLDAEAMQISATIGLAELALSGTTTVADHHYIFSDRYDYDPAEVLFDTAARFGMRFVLGRGGLTHGRPWHREDIPLAPIETLDQMLSGLATAAKRWHDPSPTAMTRVAAAPVTTVFNLREGEVREVARAARSLGLRLHTHLSENDTYVNSTLERFGKRPVHWMADQGWIGPDVWFAHLVKCEPDELALMAEAGTAMAHCPQANARLGSGIAPAPAFAKIGGLVSLAIDGTGATEAGDMAQALYSAFTIHRAVAGADATKAENVLSWATAGGARALGVDGIGTLEPGKAAELVLLDLDHLRYFGQHDATIGPIISGGDVNVKYSFVSGGEIVADGKLPWLDLKKLRADAARVVAKLQTT
jgi:cytosine/adenosine deaminase-related metal-dependent hydrolase